MLLFLKVRNNKFILVHSKFLRASEVYKCRLPIIFYREPAFIGKGGGLSVPIYSEAVIVAVPQYSVVVFVAIDSVVELYHRAGC